MLEIRDLRVCFDGVPAVDGVSLDLPAGEVLAVLGASGSGKSTLLRAVAGLERLESGTVAYDGQDLAPVPTHRRGFALMFQDGQLFPQQSVAGNVGYPLRLRRTPRARVARRVEELLELVGLPGFGARGTSGLSGGERQRVALARSLAVEPRLLLLDEPLSALDRGLRERLAHDLRDILVAAGTTALLVTHDQEEAFAVADRMALMRDGHVVQSGTVAQVWRHPADPAVDLGAGGMAEPERVGDVAGDRQLREELAVLEHQREAAPVGGHARQVVTVPADRPGREQLEPRHGPQQRRLAGSGRPEHCEHLTGGQVEAHVVDGGGAVEADGEVAELEHVRTLPRTRAEVARRPPSPRR